MKLTLDFVEMNGGMIAYVNVRNHYQIARFPMQPEDGGDVEWWYNWQLRTSNRTRRSGKSDSLSGAIQDCQLDLNRRLEKMTARRRSGRCQA